MIPANARPAHHRLREKLARILEWNETEGPNREMEGGRALGIITSGISFMHVREAAPEAPRAEAGDDVSPAHGADSPFRGRASPAAW